MEEKINQEPLSIAGQIAELIEKDLYKYCYSSLYDPGRKEWAKNHRCFFHDPLGEYLGTLSPRCISPTFDKAIWRHDDAYGPMLHINGMKLAGTAQAKDPKSNRQIDMWLFLHMVHSYRKPSQRVDRFRNILTDRFGAGSRIWYGYHEVMKALLKRSGISTDNFSRLVTSQESHLEKPWWNNLFVRLMGLNVAASKASIDQLLGFNSEHSLSESSWVWNETSHPNALKVRSERIGKKKLPLLISAFAIDRLLSVEHRLDLLSKSLGTSSSPEPSIGSALMDQVPNASRAAEAADKQLDDFEKRRIAFELQAYLDQQDTQNQSRKGSDAEPSRLLGTIMPLDAIPIALSGDRHKLPEWFSLIGNRPLRLETTAVNPDEPEILVLSGRDSDFRALFPDPDYSWVAAIEFILDGEKYETFAMNLDFETSDNELPEFAARAYLEIQETTGNPWLDPGIADPQTLRVKSVGGSRISLARIINSDGSSESSILLRIYLERAEQ